MLIMYQTGVRESNCVLCECCIIYDIKALTYPSVSTCAITSYKRQYKQVCVTFEECSDAGCSSLYNFFCSFFLAGLNKLQKLFSTFLQFDWFLLTSNWLLNFSKASSLAEKKM